MPHQHPEAELLGLSTGAYTGCVRDDWEHPDQTVPRRDARRYVFLDPYSTPADWDAFVREHGDRASYHMAAVVEFCEGG